MNNLTNMDIIKMIYQEDICPLDVVGSSMEPSLSFEDAWLNIGIKDEEDAVENNSTCDVSEDFFQPLSPGYGALGDTMEGLFDFGELGMKPASPAAAQVVEDAFVTEVCNSGCSSPVYDTDSSLFQQLLDVLEEAVPDQLEDNNIVDTTFDDTTQTEFFADQLPLSPVSEVSSDVDVEEPFSVDFSMLSDQSEDFICTDVNAVTPEAEKSVDILSLLSLVYGVEAVDGEVQNVKDSDSNTSSAPVAGEKRHAAEVECPTGEKVRRLPGETVKKAIRREKNNASSRVSRAKKRAEKEDLYKKQVELEKSNARLRLQIESMTKEAEIMREVLIAKLSGSK